MEEEENQWIKMKKGNKLKETNEIQLSLLRNDMFYVGNPQEFTKKQIHLEPMYKSPLLFCSPAVSN